jgi:hypothetical protein
LEPAALLLRPACQGEERVTKPEAIQALKLLSALESWAMSNKGLPDYLHEDIQTNMEVLERIILEPQS